jgi:hypothetical protein
MEEKQMLQSLANILTGQPEEVTPQPADVVQRGLEHFHGVIAERDTLRIRIHTLELDNARLCTELDLRISDLQESMREREHYMAYAYTLTTQLNTIDDMIRQALLLAKNYPVSPPKLAEADEHRPNGNEAPFDPIPPILNQPGEAPGKMN